MKAINTIFVIFIFCMIPVKIFCQDSLNYQIFFPNTISVRSGLGYLSVLDEGISKERYTGLLQHIDISFLKFQNNIGINKEISYYYGGKIKNNNVSAEIMNFYYSNNRFYPASKFSIFSSPVILFLGYYDDFFFYYRRQNIANGGFAFFDATSILTLTSIGFNLGLFCEVHPKFQIADKLQFTVLSLGGGLVDPEKNNTSFFKLITLFKGMNSSMKIEMLYKISNPLSLSFGYQLNFSRITTWEYYLSASDNLFIQINWNLVK